MKCSTESAGSSGVLDEMQEFNAYETKPVELGLPSA